MQETPGRRKLILATNVAETAVTIDGVVCIINSGRAKEKRFDPYSGVSTLQTTWISKANERQRRGRAGRTRTGVAFHMYSHQRAASFQVRFLPRAAGFGHVRVASGQWVAEHVAIWTESSPRRPHAASTCILLFDLFSGRVRLGASHSGAVGGPAPRGGVGVHAVEEACSIALPITAHPDRNLHHSTLGETYA